MHDLEEMVEKLLKAARKLPPGPVRHDILKEIGRFRVRLAALRAQSEQLQTSKKISKGRLSWRPLSFQVGSRRYCHNQILAPGNATYLFKEMAATCANLMERWPAIKPPAGAVL